MIVQQIRATPTLDGCEGLLATVMKYSPDSSPGANFFTPPESQLQVGLLKHCAGKTVPTHRHVHHTRVVMSTEEVIVVLKGRVRADIYTSEGALEASCELTYGDLIILHSGAHGFTVLEDCELIEVKQGPYMGGYDKVPVGLTRFL